jgi:putative membrane protein
MTVSPVQPSDAQRQLAYERTHLANERTFAAWLRTGLSVAALGIVIVRLLPGTERASGYVFALGVFFVAAGVALIAYGAWRFASVQHRLSGAEGVPRHTGPIFVAAMSTVISLLLLAVLLVT